MTVIPSEDNRAGPKRLTGLKTALWASAVLTSLHCDWALRLRVLGVLDRLVHGLALEPCHGEFQFPHALGVAVALDVAPGAADSLVVILGHG